MAAVWRQPLDRRAWWAREVRGDGVGGLLGLAAVLAAVGATAVPLAMLLAGDLARGGLVVLVGCLAYLTAYGVTQAWARRVARGCTVATTPAAAHSLDQAHRTWRNLGPGLREETLPLLDTLYRLAELAAIDGDARETRDRIGERVKALHDIAEADARRRALAYDVGLDDHDLTVAAYVREALDEATAALTRKDP